MQTLNRLTLALIVGFSIGSTCAQAENADTPDHAKQLKAEQESQLKADLQTLSKPNQDLLLQSLRKKQAELSASGVSPDAKPASISSKKQKALAKKEKADREAKLQAERKTKDAEIAAEKIKAAEEAKKKAALEKSAPVKASVAVNTPPVENKEQANQVIAALRQKQAELAAQEKAAKAVAAAPVVVAPVQSPVKASVAVNTPPVENKEQVNQVIAALRQKQAELAAQEKAAKAVVAAPVVAAPVQNLDTVTLAVNAPSKEEQMKGVMDALRKKQSELAAQEAAAKPVATQPVVETVAKPAAPAPKALTKEEKEKIKEQMAMDKASADAQKRKAHAALEEKKKADAQALLQQKNEAAASKKAAPEVVLVKAKKVTPAPKVVVDKKASKETPVQTLSKDQKLNELLRRYQADQITPREYHTERAKIMAEQ